ncbi:hypothetical protein N473_26805 [Pseudoalteromonas luteoviolacea CPMOR-1]|uniref:Uncharacterized protein n=1 Tax=Pseudoalteromonas luteoviolacea CPMOR-1 TaxID=1365248 RepID=A0A161YXL9_9GAMM|nr:hypothetical protein [Pseudoalteromonas luteoviolacea]KZN67764.1 hypothetical protein N473_26805 [Pseudoalteromonas luteoviolacea CPMOR-1]
MELQEVCESLLDNADMSIDLSAYPKVTLNILVQGTVNDKFWKVVFECGQVVHMDAEFDDDSLNNDLFMVLEASVKETIKSKVTPAVQHRMDGLNDKDPVWKVHLYGSMSLTMVTTRFNWQLIELSEKEYEAAYA